MTWRPQIFRHRRESREEYAVHEVFFAADGAVRGFTAEAVSPRYSSVEELRRSLGNLHAKLGDGATIAIGDRQCLRAKEDIALWLKHADEPVRDFNEEEA